MSAPDDANSLTRDEPDGASAGKTSIWPCYDEWSVEQWYAGEGG